MKGCCIMNQLIRDEYSGLNPTKRKLIRAMEQLPPERFNWAMEQLERLASAEPSMRDKILEEMTICKINAIERQAYLSISLFSRVFAKTLTLFPLLRIAAICGNSLQIAANCYSRKSENHKADFPLFFLKFLSSKL